MARPINSGTKADDAKPPKSKSILKHREAGVFGAKWFNAQDESRPDIAMRLARDLEMLARMKRKYFREFCRRAYVDFTGQLPTAEQLSDFTTDPQDDKRQRLVAELSKSPARTISESDAVKWLKRFPWSVEVPIHQSKPCRKIGWLKSDVEWKAEAVLFSTEDFQRLLAKAERAARNLLLWATSGVEGDPLLNPKCIGCLRLLADAMERRNEVRVIGSQFSRPELVKVIDHWRPELSSERSEREQRESDQYRPILSPGEFKRLLAFQRCRPLRPSQTATELGERIGKSRDETARLAKEAGLPLKPGKHGPEKGKKYLRH